MGDYIPLSQIKNVNILKTSTKYKNGHFTSAPDLVQLSLENSGNSKDGSRSKENLENEDLHAWLVLIAVFLFNVVIGYHVICFGIYYVTFTETFETPKAKTGFIGSINASMMSFCSLFASVFIDIIGLRKVAVIGSIVSSIGIFASSLVPSIYFLYGTYGFVTGFGISCSFLATQVAIQKHFDKHRNVATSIAVCGLPIGNLISPFITNFFLDKFGWRGTLAMHSAVMLQTVAFSLVCAPPRNQYSKNNEDNSQIQNSESTCQKFSKYLLDLFVVKDIVFIPLIIGIMCLKMSTTTYFDHLASRAVYLGASLDSAGYMITVVCLASLIGRLVCSIILGILTVNPLIILSMVLFIQGCAVLFLPLCKSYVSVIICIALFGLMQGFVIPLFLLSIVKVVGVNKFGKTRALLEIFSSATIFAATPLTGWMFDVTQNYNIPFFFSGSSGVLASVCILLVDIIHKLHKRSREQTQLEKEEEHESLNNEIVRIRTYTI